MTLPKPHKPNGRVAEEAAAAGSTVDPQRLLKALRSAEDEELAEAELEAQHEVPDIERSERLVSALRQRLAASSGPAVGPNPGPERLDVVARGRASGSQGSRIRTRPYFWTAGAMAMAAAAVLLIAPWWRTPEVLPRYGLELQGDAQRLGAAHPRSRAVRVALDSSLDIVLRPTTALHGDIEVRSYARREGRLQPLAAPLARAKEGTLSLHQPVNTLSPLGLGRWELVFVLARRGGLPTQTEVEARLATDGSGGTAEPQASWLLLRETVDVVNP